MIQPVECLPCKHSDLSLGSQSAGTWIPTLLLKANLTGHTCDPRATVSGEEEALRKVQLVPVLTFKLLYKNHGHGALLLVGSGVRLFLKQQCSESTQRRQEVEAQCKHCLKC